MIKGSGKELFLIKGDTILHIRCDFAHNKLGVDSKFHLYIENGEFQKKLPGEWDSMNDARKSAKAMGVRGVIVHRARSTREYMFPQRRD